MNFSFLLLPLLTPSCFVSGSRNPSHSTPSLSEAIDLLDSSHGACSYLDLGQHFSQEPLFLGSKFIFDLDLFDFLAAETDPTSIILLANNLYHAVRHWFRGPDGVVVEQRAVVKLFLNFELMMERLILLGSKKIDLNGLNIFKELTLKHIENYSNEFLYRHALKISRMTICRRVRKHSQNVFPLPSFPTSHFVPELLNEELAFSVPDIESAPSFSRLLNYLRLGDIIADAVGDDFVAKPFVQWLVEFTGQLGSLPEFYQHQVYEMALPAPYLLSFLEIGLPEHVIRTYYANGCYTAEQLSTLPTERLKYLANSSVDTQSFPFSKLAKLQSFFTLDILKSYDEFLDCIAQVIMNPDEIRFSALLSDLINQKAKNNLDISFLKQLIRIFVIAFCKHMNGNTEAYEILLFPLSADFVYDQTVVSFNLFQSTLSSFIFEEEELGIKDVRAIQKRMFFALMCLCQSVVKKVPRARDFTTVPRRFSDRVELLTYLTENSFWTRKDQLFAFELIQSLEETDHVKQQVLRAYNSFLESRGINAVIVLGPKMADYSVKRPEPNYPMSLLNYSVCELFIQLRALYNRVAVDEDEILSLLRVIFHSKKGNAFWVRARSVNDSLIQLAMEVALQKFSSDNLYELVDTLDLSVSNVSLTARELTNKRRQDLLKSPLFTDRFKFLLLQSPSVSVSSYLKTEDKERLHSKSFQTVSRCLLMILPNVSETHFLFKHGYYVSHIGFLPIIQEVLAHFVSKKEPPMGWENRIYGVHHPDHLPKSHESVIKRVKEAMQALEIAQVCEFVDIDPFKKYFQILAYILGSTNSAQQAQPVNYIQNADLVKARHDSLSWLYHVSHNPIKLVLPKWNDGFQLVLHRFHHPALPVTIVPVHFPVTSYSPSDIVFLPPASESSQVEATPVTVKESSIDDEVSIKRAVFMESLKEIQEKAQCHVREMVKDTSMLQEILQGALDLVDKKEELARLRKKEKDVKKLAEIFHRGTTKANDKRELLQKKLRKKVEEKPKNSEVSLLATAEKEKEGEKASALQPEKPKKKEHKQPAHKEEKKQASTKVKNEAPIPPASKKSNLAASQPSEVQTSQAPYLNEPSVSQPEPKKKAPAPQPETKKKAPAAPQPEPKEKKAPVPQSGPKKKVAPVPQLELKKKESKAKEESPIPESKKTVAKTEQELPKIPPSPHPEPPKVSDTDPIYQYFDFINGMAEPKPNISKQIQIQILNRIRAGNLPFLLSESFYLLLSQPSRFSQHHISGGLSRWQQLMKGEDYVCTRPRHDLWIPESFTFQLDDFSNSPAHASVIRFLKEKSNNNPLFASRLSSLCKYSSGNPREFSKIIVMIGGQCLIAEECVLWVPSGVSGENLEKMFEELLGLRQPRPSLASPSLSDYPSVSPSFIPRANSNILPMPISNSITLPTQKPFQKAAQQSLPKATIQPTFSSNNAISHSQFPTLAASQPPPQQQPAASIKKPKPSQKRPASARIEKLPGPKPTLAAMQGLKVPQAAPTVPTAPVETKQLDERKNTSTEVKHKSVRESESVQQVEKETASSEKMGNPNIVEQPKDEPKIRVNERVPGPMHLNVQAPVWLDWNYMEFKDIQEVLASGPIQSQRILLYIGDLQQEINKLCLSNIISKADEERVQIMNHEISKLKTIHRGLRDDIPLVQSKLVQLYNLIQDSDLVAIDFELTGLDFGEPLRCPNDLKDSLESVKRNSIVQLGLMLMKKDEHGRIMQVNSTYSVWKIPICFNNRTDNGIWIPGSKEFLYNNGFDFCKWKLGCLDYSHLKSIWDILLSKPLVTHNGMLDMLHLFKAAGRLQPLLSIQTVPELKEFLTNNGYEIYDTRPVCSRHEFRGGLDALSAQILPNKTFEEGKSHDAAFDAFRTGHIFRLVYPPTQEDLNLLPETTSIVPVTAPATFEFSEFGVEKDGIEDYDSLLFWPYQSAMPYMQPNYEVFQQAQYEPMLMSPHTPMMPQGISPSPMMPLQQQKHQSPQLEKQPSQLTYQVPQKRQSLHLESQHRQSPQIEPHYPPQQQLIYPIMPPNMMPQNVPQMMYSQYPVMSPQVQTQFVVPLQGYTQMKEQYPLPSAPLSPNQSIHQPQVFPNNYQQQQQLQPSRPPRVYGKQKYRVQQDNSSSGRK